MPALAESKVQKAYRITVDLVKRIGAVSNDRRVPECRIVEAILWSVLRDEKALGRILSSVSK